jgi:hypothetical protein
MFELHGAVAKYIQIIRSNQTTDEEKEQARLACWSLAHSDHRDCLVDLWLLLQTLERMTGAEDGSRD